MGVPMTQDHPLDTPHLSPSAAVPASPLPAEGPSSENVAMASSGDGDNPRRGPSGDDAAATVPSNPAVCFPEYPVTMPEQNGNPKQANPNRLSLLSGKIHELD
jgi:hypothetical protein